MIKSYYQLSQIYNTLYRENIELFQRNIKPDYIGDEFFVDFYPSIGNPISEDIDFLVYGQAVNGWCSGFDLHHVIDEAKIQASIATSNNFLTSLNHSPIDWVNVHWCNSSYEKATLNPIAKEFYSKSKNTVSSSFFWNVVYKLINDYYQLERGSWEWSKHMVWSNLYKIAPQIGNPTEYLKLHQQSLALKLVKQELDEISPKYCIVLTNYNWWRPFAEFLSTTQITQINHQSEIVSVEQYGKTKIVVTTRPPVGESESHVNQILDVINQPAGNSA